MLFKHIAIVGVGLIGGSFALAVRRAGLCERVTGWDGRDVLDQAIACGAIDDVESAFYSKEKCNADLVYLAAPVDGIIECLRSKSSSFKSGSVVTDAGSTKREICRVAREALPSDVAFVGGHPMAGSEKGGIEFADADLFRGAAYALVPGEHAAAEVMTAMTELVKGIGATPLAVTAARHDEIAARVSHAPQLISTALALAISRTNDAGTLSFSGTGLAEMTRLAGSRWSVWEDICRTNADEISSALDEVIKEIDALRVAVAAGDFLSAGDMFSSAAEYARVLRESKG